MKNSIISSFFILHSSFLLSRPALDYRELSCELEDEGWFSRSLDAAILDLIRVQ